MDYTTLVTVKQALGADSNAGDSELNRFITAVSRAMDRRLTQNVRTVDYAKLETITEENHLARVDYQGHILVHAFKPKVVSVSDFQYRFSPDSSWVTVSPSYVFQKNDYSVEAWLGLTPGPKNIFCKLSYQGGLGATVADLPADFIEAATVLAVRYYKEMKSGLSDSIGIAELGTLIYTKAWPVRVLDLLQYYFRVVPWR